MTELSAEKSILGFVKFESKGHLKSWWHASTRSWLAFTAFAWLWMMVQVATNGQPKTVMDWLVGGLVLVGYAGYLAVFVGVTIGFFVVAWRMFGAWSFLAVFVTLLIFGGVFWISGGWLEGLLQDIYVALKLSAQKQGMSHTMYVLNKPFHAFNIGPAGRIGPVALIVLPFIYVWALLALVPSFVMDLVQISFAPTVCWEVFQMLMGLGLLMLVSTILSAFTTIPPLTLAFINRLKKRYEEYKTS